MESRSFDKVKDYGVISKWCESWGWPAFPLEYLPTEGIVISDGDVDICAGWLYKTDSMVCWAENYISNKEATKEQRDKGLRYLIDELTEIARAFDYKLMMSTIHSSNKGMINKLLDSGFEGQYETNMCNLTRIL